MYISMKVLIYLDIHSLDEVVFPFILNLYGAAKVESLSDVFAFSYFQEKQHLYYKNCIPKNQGWSLYSMSTEFQRQGVLLDALSIALDDSLPSSPSKSPSENNSRENLTEPATESTTHSSKSTTKRKKLESTWRVSLLNQDYNEIPSYPSSLVVPMKIADSALHYAAKYRSKGRIPALSFRYCKNKCVILRSSQPLTGLSMKRSFQDEKLVQELFKRPKGVKEEAMQNDLHSPNEIREKELNFILDARSVASAMANFAAGAGTENLDYYKNCQRVYLGIDNIHGIRDSFLRLLESFTTLAEVPDFCDVASSSYEFQAWYKHLSCILDASIMIARFIHEEHSVLVHCSDGWDRTTQVISIASILLDPYYRTIPGLLILIEKEWLSFGHRFLDRSGLLSNVLIPSLPSSLSCFSYQKKSIRDFSPIFPQFCEVLYQLINIAPNAFQFNEKTLRFLCFHYYSGKYGNFLFNSEKDAVSLKPDVDETSGGLAAVNDDVSRPLYKNSCPSFSSCPSFVPPDSLVDAFEGFVVVDSPSSMTSALFEQPLDPNYGRRVCDFTVHIYEDIMEDLSSFANTEYSAFNGPLLPSKFGELRIWKELYFSNNADLS